MPPLPDVCPSIEYEFTPRPSGIAADFKPIGETSLSFLTIKAIDGHATEAALWLPAKKEAADTTLLVMIHAALALNTRQHDDKVNTDNFLEVRRDIEAAVQVGRALGYKTFVLQGHSLGTIQVQFYAATNWDSDIRAVILLGAFSNLPWKSRNLLVQDEARFRSLIEASLMSLREGTLDQVLPVEMRFSTPVSSTTASAGPDIPITGQHFLTYRWDRTSVADGTSWLPRIPRPVLVVRDQSDAVVQPFEPHMLLSAAQSEGSLVTSIHYVLLPNSKPVGLSGHYFAGNEQPLMDVIAKWLADRGL